MIIPGFDNYDFSGTIENPSILNVSTKKEISVTKCKNGEGTYSIKMVNNEGKRKSLTKGSLNALINGSIIPDDVVVIPLGNKNYVMDKFGNIYSKPNHQYPQGCFRKGTYSKSTGYLSLSIRDKNKNPIKYEVYKIVEKTKHPRMTDKEALITSLKVRKKDLNKDA
jgi:hypothetical protein